MKYIIHSIVALSTIIGLSACSDSKTEKEKVNTSPTSSNQKEQKNTPKATSSSQDKESTTDNLAMNKYNYFVHMINNITPNMNRTFNIYTRECGTDKAKRVRARVEAALKMSGGQNRKAYEDSYGFHLGQPYSQEDKEEILAVFDKALKIERFAYADTILKDFKSSVSKFMDVYSEDAEYFSMKDFTEDNFKKGNELHAPIITAYENIMKSDRALRKVIDEISDKQALARIAKFKKDNKMLPYHIEKSQYLSKKFFEYANHKEDYMTLDAKEVRKKYDGLRAEYDAFKKYKQTNSDIFKNNRGYDYYLNKYKEYVSSSKDFYLKVKSKKEFGEGEEEFLKNIPAIARQSMAVNREGSLRKLLQDYNNLVNQYNSLN